jgi:hypothetical protein
MPRAEGARAVAAQQATLTRSTTSRSTSASRPRRSSGTSATCTSSTTPASPMASRLHRLLRARSREVPRKARLLREGHRRGDYCRQEWPGETWAGSTSSASTRTARLSSTGTFSNSSPPSRRTPPRGFRAAVGAPTVAPPPQAGRYERARMTAVGKRIRPVLPSGFPVVSEHGDEDDWRQSPCVVSRRALRRLRGSPQERVRHLRHAEPRR